MCLVLGVRERRHDCIFKNRWTIQIEKRKERKYFWGDFFFEFRAPLSYKDEMLFAINRYSVWTNWFCIVFDRRRWWGALWRRHSSTIIRSPPPTHREWIVLKTLLAGKSADDDDLRAFCSSPFAKATEMEQFQDLLLAAHIVYFIPYPTQ